MEGGCWVVSLDSMAEWVVWSAMSGAIALLCLVALGDLFAQRSLASARGLAFIAMTGGASVWMSGLPGLLFPGLDPQIDLVLQASLGPLAGALALSYLGVWMCAGRDDPLTRWLVLLGSAAFVVATVVLALLASLGAGWSRTDVLLASAAVNLATVATAAFVSVRGAVLGDALARWMVVACACLALMVLGLYAHALGLSGLGLFAWVVTALATVAYFLIVIVLTIQRNREVRRMRQLASGLTTENFNIAMPQGPQLIPRVADAIWRSERLERDCVVAAIVVRNLYELGDHLGHGVEAQILSVLAARIRRHVGFRNVVGLYHPRCFVLAVSPGQDPRRGELLVETLLRSLRDRVRVGPLDQRFDFWPSVGMGVVELKHHPLSALDAIHRAEQLALEDLDIDEMLSRPMEQDPGPRVF